MADMKVPSAMDQDVRPQVAKAPRSRGILIFAAFLVATSGGVFYALQIRRESLGNTSLVSPEADGDQTITSPPELSVSAQPFYPLPPTNNATTFAAETGRAITYPSDQQRAPQSPVYTSRVPDRGVMMGPSLSGSGSNPTGPSFLQQSVGPGVSYQAPTAAPSVATSDQSSTSLPDKRVQARKFVNPSATVPQGSVIHAVMETALDSTRAGFARAVVSRDVLSFDGTRVLIPKGSRLFGNYQADVTLGQKRALIQWQRLTRPDGVLIDLDSPAADPLGRAGLKGKVNTHFFQRFSGAILQSLLDIGVRAATRQVDSNTVIVGLPGSNTLASPIQSTTDIKPTLKISQGASVSVFVAKDLDFSTVNQN